MGRHIIIFQRKKKFSFNTLQLLAWVRSYIHSKPSSLFASLDLNKSTLSEELLFYHSRLESYSLNFYFQMPKVVSSKTFGVCSAIYLVSQYAVHFIFVMWYISEWNRKKKKKAFYQFLVSLGIKPIGIGTYLHIC